MFVDALSQSSFGQELIDFPTTSAEESQESNQVAVVDFIKTEEALPLKGEIFSQT